MRTQRQIRCFSLLSALILAAAVIAAMWIGGPKNGLLDHAVLLVRRSEWVGAERRNGSVANYDWISNDELILFTRNNDATISFSRKRVIPAGPSRPATPLPIAPIRRPEFITLLPDRATLHVLRRRTGAPRRISAYSEFISARDGHKVGAHAGYANGEWYAGTKSVCEFEYGANLVATVHNYDSGKDERILIGGVNAPGMARGYYWPLFIERSGRAVGIGDSYYDGIVTPADRAKLGIKLSPVRTFVEFNLKYPAKKARYWTVQVPVDAATFYCQVAPGHNRLLWTVQSNRLPPLSSFLQRLPGPLKRNPRYLARWMVSDLEGKGMRTIAEFPISDLHFNRPDLINPRWTPDGQHVSFEFEGALYLLAAP